MSDNTNTTAMLDEYVAERATMYKDTWYHKGRKLFVAVGTKVNNCNFKLVKQGKKVTKEASAPTGKEASAPVAPPDAAVAGK